MCAGTIIGTAFLPLQLSKAVQTVHMHNHVVGGVLAHRVESDLQLLVAFPTSEILSSDDKLVNLYTGYAMLWCS